jgi:FdhE protein
MTAPPAGGARAPLVARHPEYASWLALLDTARAALDDPAWTAAVPEPSASPPFVDGATFTVDARRAERLVHVIFGRAGVAPPADTLVLLQAAIVEDADVFHGRGGLEASAAALATLPLLHACRRAWEAAIPASWIDAACPICGAWAAVVEARGLERRLRHRCGRCGADWAAEPVHCPFCHARDHSRLTTLVSERAAERGRVEACHDCRGYLKTITTLAPCPPDEVGLLDLETVHLDVAAMEHGFRRPPPRPRRAIVRPRTSRLRALLRGRS